MAGMTDIQALRRIAANVKRLREESGLSMRELARLAHDVPSAVKRIEDAENMPGVGMLTRFAEALGVTVNDLLAEPKKILARAS
jgi:transcriptional regulator with XRE-family HTH domain